VILLASTQPHDHNKLSAAVWQQLLPTATSLGGGGGGGVAGVGDVTTQQPQGPWTPDNALEQFGLPPWLVVTWWCGSGRACAPGPGSVYLRSTCLYFIRWGLCDTSA
jgi:hypothetical protein